MYLLWIFSPLPMKLYSHPYDSVIKHSLYPKKFPHTYLWSIPIPTSTYSQPLISVRKQIFSCFRTVRDLWANVTGTWVKEHMLERIINFFPQSQMVGSLGFSLTLLHFWENSFIFQRLAKENVWGEDAVGEAPSMEPGGPEFGSLALKWKLGMVTHICNLSSGGAGVQCRVDPQNSI